MSRKYLSILFFIGLMSNIALGIEVSEEKIDQFTHRYLNDGFGESDRHCHDGYCYFEPLRGDIDVYWRKYGDEEYENNNRENSFQNNTRIKINIDRAEEIVKASLRQHQDLFEYLSEITTSSELLPYLEKYKALKMKFTSKPLSPGLKIILVEDQHIPPSFIGRGAGVGRCDYSEGIVLINANSWNSCIKHDDVLSEFLVFHEIAHCDLKRTHGDDDDGDGDGFLSFMDQFLTGNSLNQVLTGPIKNSCESSIDALNVFREMWSSWPNELSFERGYIQDNLEQLYAELFSKDKFYNYDDLHYENNDHTEYRGVEDLSEFTTVVNNDIVAIKQKLQRLARDQRQNL